MYRMYEMIVLNNITILYLLALCVFRAFIRPKTFWYFHLFSSRKKHTLQKSLFKIKFFAAEQTLLFLLPWEIF